MPVTTEKACRKKHRNSLLLQDNELDWDADYTEYDDTKNKYIFHGDEKLNFHHKHDERDSDYEDHKHIDTVSSTLRDTITEKNAALQSGFYNKNIIELAKQQNEYMRRRFSTKQSQYEYKTGQNRFLNNFTYALLWVYFILAAIYLAIVFVSPKRDQFSYQYKVAVLLILVLYPFVITPIEYFILRGLALIVETVVGNVFERDDYEYVMDYTHLPNFFSY